MLGPEIDSASNVNKMKDSPEGSADAATSDTGPETSSSECSATNPASNTVERQAQAAAQPDKPSPLKKLAQSKHLNSLVFIAIVLLSLPIFLCQNPSSVLPRTTMYFDAAHYLETTKRLFETCSLFFAGKVTAGALDSLAYYLFLDGPVLPGAASILFFLLGKTPALSEWQSLVAMQCVFQALCSGFVYLLARVFFRQRILAVSAAVLWTSYPSAISSCNSFLTEPLAAFLSVAFMYALTGLAPGAEVEGKTESSDFIKCAGAGLCLSLLVLLKPALAPAAMAATLVYAADFIHKISKTRTVNAKSILPPAMALIGAAIVFIPWLSFGFAARHTLTIMPSRRPVYNIATGCNVEGDGWGCYPTHPVALMFDDNEAAMPVALALVEANPQEIANLSLRKISRLWNLPWNDYRYKILGLNYHIQSIYHLLLVMLGINGILLIFAGLFQSRLSFQQKLAAASIMLFLAGHLIYLPFEGIGRYGFTSMPFLIIAAVYLFQELNSFRHKWLQLSLFGLAFILMLLTFKLDLLPYILVLTKAPDSAIIYQAIFRTASVAVCGLALSLALAQLRSKAMLTAVAASTLLAGSIAFSFALSDREALQWQCILSAEDRAERAMKVRMAPFKKPDWALLLVDGDQNVESARVNVNGANLDGTLESLYQFQTEKYELEDWLNQFASLTRRAPSANRKWRAIEVPVTSIHDGTNYCSISSINPAAKGTSATIYGDYVQRSNSGKLMLPSADQVSPGKFFNDSEDGFDSRIMQRTSSKIAEASSVLYQNGTKQVDDLSRKSGRQTGQFRIYLLLGYKTKKEDETNKDNAAIRESLIFKRSLSAGPSPDTPIKLNAATIYPQMSVAIPSQCKTGTHIRVRISGKARGANSASFSVAGISSENKRFMSTVLPGAPMLVSAQAAWTTFEFQSDLPTVTSAEDNASLKVELKPVNGNTEICKLQIELRPIKKPQLSGHSIRVF